MFAQFWRKRVQLPSGIRSGAPTKPDLGSSTVADITRQEMARVSDPIVISLTNAIHDLLCGNSDPASGRACPRFVVASAHWDYYELRAEILLEKLSPMVGRGNVRWLVIVVINELDL